MGTVGSAAVLSSTERGGVRREVVLADLHAARANGAAAAGLP
ncbi:hypothetical protein [Saccharopolyspora spinosa]|uniref:Uncharacterized protein n=1 Tax=Saccharopolyspora spinosa TaxID=60894 RepID=A0A2N3Y5Q5_SACSN|nr:hypothetical protein [Saccharopolyspora spinosa]PKW18238.1 hypothetical protein A8926_6308 [Saccharopolyspora spinosa]